MPTTPFTVRLDQNLQSHLERLADLLGRPRSWVINRALENYLHAEEWHLAELQKRVAAADAGDFADDHDVEAFFQQWR